MPVNFPGLLIQVQSESLLIGISRLQVGENEPSPLMDL